VLALWKEPLGGWDKPLTNDQLTQTVFKAAHGTAVCVDVSQYLPYAECAAWQNLWDLYQSPEVGQKFAIDPNDWCGSGDVYLSVNLTMDYNWARTDPCRCSRIKCEQSCLTPPHYVPPVDPRKIYGTITNAPTPVPRAKQHQVEFGHEYIDYFHKCNLSLGSISAIDFSGLNLPGPIPEMIHNFTGLKNLTLRNNRFTGPVHEKLFDLEIVQYVDLSANRLVGTLSDSIARWSNLTFLDLHQNQLRGTLPISLQNVSRLRSINLATNEFSGAIPLDYGRLQRLERVEFQGNQLTREIPQTFENLLELTHLDLSNNYITGTLPGSFFENLCFEQEALLTKSPHKLAVMEGNYPFNLLKHLNLQHNKLIGTIPKELGLNCFWLEYLLLGDNKLSGSIPSDIFIEMSKVFSFDVGSNLLTGVLPTSLTYLPRLSELDASNNLLHGNIEYYIANISIYWTDPGYETKFEPKPLMSRLKLHNNRISGQLPQELADIAYLEFLSVQNNQITGPLPQNISWGTLEGCGLAGNTWDCPIPCAVLNNASCDIPIDYCAGECYH
jgi:Leucine-rich repeat (LRR) protein